MKHTLYNYCLIVLLLLSTVSCKKFLEAPPTDSIVGENFWVSETAAESFMNGGYALLRKAVRSPIRYTSFEAFLCYGALRSDEWEKFGTNAVLPYVMDNNLVRGDLSLLTNWSAYYSIVAQTNLIIDKVPQMDPKLFTGNKQAQLVAEAKFLRAFTYFYMVRVWGDVPLVLKPVYNPKEAVSVPRALESTVLDTCIHDLKEAAAVLDWTYTDATQRAVRGNKGTCYATLAHIYAWRHAYAEAESACDEVINSQQYKLVDTTNYTDLYKPGTSERETIFIIPFSEASNESMGAGFWRYMLGDPYNPGATVIYQIHRNNLANWYYDIRMVPNPLDTSKLIPDTLYTDVRFRKFFTWDTTRTAASQVIVCTKYANGALLKIGTTGTNEYWTQTPYIIFRLADIMLLKAEALQQQGKLEDARGLLNQMLQRVNRSLYTGPDTGLLAEILNERERELVAEGQRMYDLQRTRLVPLLKNNYPNSAFPMTDANYATGGWYWPVDPLIITSDAAIKQTNYWVGKL